jgi:hypothetical protein
MEAAWDRVMPLQIHGDAAFAGAQQDDLAGRLTASQHRCMGVNLCTHLMPSWDSWEVVCDILMLL